MKIFVSLAMADGEQHKTLDVVAPSGKLFHLDGEHAQVVFESGEHSKLSVTAENVEQLKLRIVEINDNNSQMRHDLNSAQSFIDDLQKQLTSAKNSG